MADSRCEKQMSSNKRHGKPYERPDYNCVSFRLFLGESYVLCGFSKATMLFAANMPALRPGHDSEEGKRCPHPASGNCRGPVPSVAW